MIRNIRKKIDRYKSIHEQEKAETRMICNGDLKLFIDQGNNFRIHYKGIEVTKASGLVSGMLSEGKWHNSSDSQIEIIKRTPDQIVVCFSIERLPLKQVWDLRLQPEGILSWDVNMHITSLIRIDQRNAFIFLSKAYKDWVALPETGRFPSCFSHEWKKMNSNEDSADFIAAQSSMEEYPSIVFKKSKDSKGFLIINNTDMALSSRVLKMWLEEESEYYQPGVYLLSSAIIEFYSDKPVLANMVEDVREEERRRKREEEFKKEEEERRAREELKRQEEERKKEELIRLQEEKERLKRTHEEDERLRTLEAEPFRLYMDRNNSFHIYYKDYELTKGSGINIGMLSEGNWYSSSNSQVRIERPSHEEMVIHFAHNQLPLAQTWQLGFKSPNMLTWKARLEPKQPLRIDKKNATVFLSKLYKNWISPPQEGVFPVYFNSEWQKVNPSENGFEFIGLRSSLGNMPDVVLKNLGNAKGLLTIQNTDINLSSRVLEFQLEEESEYCRPGSYPFIDAIVHLYPDKGALNDIMQDIQEEENRRQEKERKKQEEENRRQEEERKKQEAKGREKLEQEKKCREEEERRKQFRDDVDSIKTGTPMVIYGDNEELHDKISSESGSFVKNVSKIKTCRGKDVNIRIGISRFNFFKLNDIAQFCSSLVNQRIDLRSVSLNLFPVSRLYYNFIDHTRELRQRVSSVNIDFFMEDERLLEFLNRISSQADQYNEKDLLRLLGVISEHAFIGPQTIVIDTYHPCNTNCIHCWIHTPKRRLSADTLNLKMDFSLYKNIIDDAARLLCDEIIFQGDGEPLLDNRFIRMVRYARDKGLKTIFFTNGILLDEDRIQKIIDMEVSEIFCSLPSGTDKTYALINSARTGDTFHEIVGNLKKLISARKSSGKERPLLQMTHVIHNLNCHELEEMSKIDVYIGADRSRFYLARLDDNINFLKIKPHQIDKIKGSLKKISSCLKKNNIELQDNIYFQLKNYNSATGYWSENKFLKSGCPVGWFFSLVLAKGEVSMCCHLRVVDYLKKKRFYDAWTSENYNKFRVSAKYLTKNKDIVFPNGVKLYDEFCNHCDTHQVILRINELLREYNLHSFA